MTRIYSTTDGDVLDDICVRELGSADLIAAVLEANPGLAALGPIYPAGLAIILPDAPAVTSAGQVRLWGRT